jgi:transposase
MSKGKRYSSELRERAVRMVFEHEKDHDSQWGAICSISEKVGCTSETLRRWVRQAERDTGLRTGPKSGERERVRELERENRELKRANEILRKASAYFALAELDRRRK